MDSGTVPLHLDAMRCTGCGRCVSACPERLFTLATSGYRKNAAIIAPERCTRCMRCQAECPVGALTLVQK